MSYLTHTALTAIEPKILSTSVDEETGEPIGYDADANVIEYDKAAYEAKYAELKVAHDAVAYKAKREMEYPELREQLDMIYHAGQGGDAFQAAIKAVKDKYPKPE